MGMLADSEERIRLCLWFNINTMDFARKILCGNLSEIVLLPEQIRICHHTRNKYTVNRY